MCLPFAVIKILMLYQALDISYADRVSVPLIGERYRGAEGRIGYLLRQAWAQLRAAMDDALREHGLTAPQYATLTILARDPGISGADLARATMTTPQAMNGVIGTLERAGLVERHPHPTHGRILQVDLTEEGHRRIAAARPVVEALEERIEEGFSAEEVAVIKAWLVVAARRLERAGPEQ
jgi:DNA-binding MarR family transcriptional regulator